jgi:hypothetical protein
VQLLQTHSNSRSPENTNGPPLHACLLANMQPSPNHPHSAGTTLRPQCAAATHSGGLVTT